MIRRRLHYFYVCLLIFMSIIGCGQQSSKVVIAPIYSDNFTAYELDIAQKAFAVFSNTCKPLMTEYTADIESINLENGFDRDVNISGDGCLDYRCKEFGWDKQIYIKIKLKDRLSSVPRELYAQGHTLHFYLGGPKNPGYTVGKFPELCGAQKPTDGSYDVYIADPNLSFVKK